MFTQSSMPVVTHLPDEYLHELRTEAVRIFAVLILAAWPIIELLQGYLYGEGATKLLTNVGAISLIVSSLLFAGLAGLSRSSSLLILGGLTLLSAILAQRALFYDYNIQKLVFDLSPILRGVLLFGAVRTLLTSSRFPDARRFCRKYLWYTWGLIGTSVLASFATGIGLFTYEVYQAGSKFYFPSNNELTFVYSLTALVLILQLRTIPAAVVLALTAGVLLLIGTKGGFALLAIGVLSYAASYLWLRDRRIQALSIVTAVGLLFAFSLLFFDVVASWVIQLLSSYSTSAVKLQDKIQRLDALSALWSERNILAQHALSLFSSASLKEVLAGLGFYTYAISFYQDDSVRFAEIDFVDILCGWGVIGAAIYLWIPLTQLTQAFSHHSASPNARATKVAIALSFLLASNLTGHVALFSYPMIIFAIALCCTDHSKPIGTLTLRMEAQPDVGPKTLGA